MKNTHTLNIFHTILDSVRLTSFPFISFSFFINSKFFASIYDSLSIQSLVKLI